MVRPRTQTKGRSTARPCHRSPLQDAAEMPVHGNSVKRIPRDTYRYFDTIPPNVSATARPITASSAVTRVPSGECVSTAVHLIDGGAHGPPEVYVRIHRGGLPPPRRGMNLKSFVCDELSWSSPLRSTSPFGPCGTARCCRSGSTARCRRCRRARSTTGCCPPSSPRCCPAPLPSGTPDGR